MLSSVLRYLNNYFVAAIYDGRFTVESGGITLPFLRSGQYFRMFGSVFSDGVYKYPAQDLADEVFCGTIWALAVPPDIVALSGEIADWCAENRSALLSPYTSESFGAYSYTRSSGGADGSGGAAWAAVFADRLAPYRCPREISSCGARRYLYESD